jgi:hypothetical protein
MKKSGSISLLVAFQVWCLKLLRLDILTHQDGKLSRRVLADHCGFADWFAVSLFHEIPIPLSASIQTLSLKKEKTNRRNSRFSEQ